MRSGLALAVAAAFVGGSSIAVHAQPPAVVIPGAGVPGTGIANGPAAAGAGTGAGARELPGAGTGGIAQTPGTGGVMSTPGAGTGGVGEFNRRAAHTGGIKE